MAFLKLYRLLFNTLLLAGIALFAGQATAITILNSSFESPAAPSGPVTGCPTSWLCSDPTIEGVYRPGATQYPTPNGLPSGFVPDGLQVAFMDTGGANQSMTQATTATFVTGKKYTLTAWAGWRNDSAGSTWGPNIFIELLGLGAGGTGAVTQIVSSPGQGNWTQVTLNYTAVAADNGNIIRVGLLGDTNGNRVQINWDDIHLTVPEPSTLLLLGLGFALLAFATRRTKI